MLPLYGVQIFNASFKCVYKVDYLLVVVGTAEGEVLYTSDDDTDDVDGVSLSGFQTFPDSI